jgi:predicted glycosyltransferase
LSAWNTLHDIGEAGIGDSLHDFIANIAERFHVFIVPEEGKLDPALEKYRYKIAPDYYHDSIAFARLVITEGASTASEAACLGVPAVYVNTTRRGYLEDQEKRYQLVFNFQEIQPALAKTLELLEPTVDLDYFRQQSFKMHEEHIDVVEFVVETLQKAAKRELL